MGGATEDGGGELKVQLASQGMGHCSKDCSLEAWHHSMALALAEAVLVGRKTSGVHRKREFAQGCGEHVQAHALSAAGAKQA